MPLQPQPYALQFVGGLDSKTDSKQVGYTKLLDLQNAVFVKQTTLVKRNGYRALASTVEGTLASVTGPKGLATRDGELIEFANGHAYSQIETGRWSDTGGVSSTVASSQPIARTGTAQSLPETATNGGVTVAAWEDSRGGVWVSTIDASGREILAATQLSATGQRPRCVPVGNNLAVIYAVASLGQLWVAIINPVAPGTVLASQLLVEDLSTNNPAYDAEPTLYGYNTDKPAILTWTTASAIRIGYLHPSGTIGGPLNGLPSVGTFPAVTAGPIAICWYLSNPTPAAPVACLFYATSNNHVAFWFVNGANFSDTSGQFGTAVTALTAIQRIAAAFDGTGIAWVAGEATGAGDATTNFTAVASVTQAGAVTSGGTIRGHGLVSRAFLDNGQVYAAIVHPAFYFSYAAVVRISAAAGSAAPNACRILCGQSPGLPARQHLASVSALGLSSTDYASRQHAIPLLYRIQLGADPTTNAASGNYGEVGIRLVSLDFDNAAAWQTAQLGHGLYLGSACIQHYDSQRWAEADFHCAPDTAGGGLAAPLIAEGAFNVSAGTYNYIACYEEIDGLGELHQGPCSVPATATLGATGKVTLAIPTYRLTSKRRVRIGIYRSPVNQTGEPDTIPYYRVSSLDVTAVGNNGYVANDTTVDTVSFTDNISNATLTTLEPLYTNGGILSNDPVESAGGAIVAGKNRLFWLDPHDVNVVHFSQELRDDTAAELAAPLTLRTDPYGGDAVGLAIMDAGLIVLKETAVYVVDGPGPLANPDAGTDAFSPPTLVTSDVGCKAPRSVAQTPIGITFQSDKGIKLLGRDRQVQDIGADVYGYNGQTVSRATLLPDRHQIVFLTSAGSTLLYDYERGQWSRFTNHEGLDAVIWNGTYCYLRADGRVFVETVGVYRDDNSHIPMVIETAWVKFSGQLQNWQKVLRAAVIGAYKSSHQLQIRYRINYQEAYTTLTPINVDALYSPSLYGAGLYGAGSYGGTVGSDTVYQVQTHLNVRCQSISMQFSDVESTDAYGAAFELSELLLTGGVIGTRFPMGASRSQ